jgi:hypothetical protein
LNIFVNPEIMKTNYKKYLPYLLAVVVFAILTLIYFKPLLSGKELRQDDIARHKGMSKEIADFREQHQSEPLWTNSMFGGMPAYQISAKYPGNWLGFFDRLFKLFLPHPGAYLFLYCLGFFILLLCLEVDPWLSLVGGLAYGLSSYFLIIIEAGHNSKANALGYLPAMVGGVILLFRGRYWLGLAVTTLFTALELNANHVQISYYGYMIIAFIIAGYFLVSLREKAIPGFFKALGLFLLASLIGLMPNAASLLATNEYGAYSTRGKTELTIKSNLKKHASPDQADSGLDETRIEPLKADYEKNTTSGLDTDYATQWSYGIGETFTFLIPDFKGGASNSIGMADQKSLKKVNPEFREDVARSNAYFGDQPFTSGPVYIGAIVVLLAMIGMFVVKHPVKWPLFLVTLLTIALGWGSNFMSLTSFFMHYVPGYNKFRAVSMIMIVAELTLPVLAIMAVNELIRIRSWEEKIRLGLIGKELSLKKIVTGCVIVLGGFCLIGYLSPSLVNTFHASNEEEIMIRQAVNSGNPEGAVRSYITALMPEIEKAREAIFRSDAMRSAIFIGLAFLLLYLFYAGRLKRELFLGSLGLFILIDLWTVDQRYLNERSFITKEQNRQSLVAKTQADEEILADPTLNYRVLNLSVNTFNDASTSYYHKSVGGYHGAKLKKYQELIEFHLDKEINQFYKNAGKAFASDSATNELLGSLGVINMLNTRYLILPGGQGREEMPLLNRQANGNAWFVKQLFVVPDADDEILGLRRLDTKHQAITTEKFTLSEPLKTDYPAEGTIRLVSYQPNALAYESDSPAEEFAVFSEIYYPKGWNAYVDGELKPHIAVNYVLRGMTVPAGKHKIEFRFEPDTYTTGNRIALTGSILLLLTVGGGLYMNGRKKKGNNVIVS